MQKKYMEVTHYETGGQKTKRRYPERKLNVRFVIFFLLTVCFSLFFVIVWQILVSREYHLQNQKTAMSNLSQTLSSQAYASIKQVDTALFGLVKRLEITGLTYRPISESRNLLHAQRSELPQLQGIFVFNEKGSVVVDSEDRPKIQVDLQGQDFFLFHRDHFERGPHIGRPLRIPPSAEWVIPVSRRINNSDGSFAGLAVAFLYANDFLKLYNSIEVGVNGVINLISADARIVVRRPFNEAEIGMDVSNGPLFKKLLPKGDSGSAVVQSAVDGVERVIAFRRVDEYPLIIYTAVSKEEVLSAWRKESLLSGAIAAILMVVLFLFGSRLFYLMKKQNRIQKKLIDAQEELMKINQSLGLLALQDALTGLANRRQFDLYLRSEFGRAQRNRRSVALLMLDVDHFKNFNDKFGHLKGDDCLRVISNIIRSSINRPGDLAARYGGEEFGVILPDTDGAGAYLVAERIRLAVEQCAIPGSFTARTVTVSLGVFAGIPLMGLQPENFIEYADRALYIAKSSGRNKSIIGCDD